MRLVSCKCLILHTSTELAPFPRAAYKLQRWAQARGTNIERQEIVALLWIKSVAAEIRQVISFLAPKLKALEKAVLHNLTFAVLTPCEILKLALVIFMWLDNT